MSHDNDTWITSERAPKLKMKIKRNIAKAWYKLDQKSYDQWLEGRAASKASQKHLA